jgi:hypothetical protein
MLISSETFDLIGRNGCWHHVMLTQRNIKVSADILHPISPVSAQNLSFTLTLTSLATYSD